MRRVFAALLLIFGGLAVSCASIRTTGPKTAFDRCVDDCDNTVPHCSFSAEPSCRIEYDACVQTCDAREEARR